MIDNKPSSQNAFERNKNPFSFQYLLSQNSAERKFRKVMGSLNCLQVIKFPQDS